MKLSLNAIGTVAALAIIWWPSSVVAEQVQLAGHLRQDSLAEQIDQLAVADEQRAGYDRDLFGGYDRDALLAESWSEHGCYYSRADDTCHSDPGDVDVDHIVALAEAWDSGAGDWTQNQRDRFAADTDNLWLMTDALNQAKSDLDIAQWQPPDATVVCDYLRRWVQVKLSYDLSVDKAELAAISRQAEGCRSTIQPVTPGLTATTIPASSSGAASPAAGVSQQPDPAGVSPAVVGTLACLLTIVVLALVVLVAQRRRRPTPDQ